jgi:hypothetical protein
MQKNLITAIKKEFYVFYTFSFTGFKDKCTMHVGKCWFLKQVLNRQCASDNFIAKYILYISQSLLA